MFPGINKRKGRQYHVLDIDERVIDGHNLCLASENSNAGHQATDAAKSERTKMKGVSLCSPANTHTHTFIDRCMHTHVMHITNKFVLFFHIICGGTSALSHFSSRGQHQPTHAHEHIRTETHTQSHTYGAKPYMVSSSQPITKGHIYTPVFALCLIRRPIQPGSTETTQTSELRPEVQAEDVTRSQPDTRQLWCMNHVAVDQTVAAVSCKLASGWHVPVRLFEE